MCVYVSLCVGESNLPFCPVRVVKFCLFLSHTQISTAFHSLQHRCSTSCAKFNDWETSSEWTYRSECNLGITRCQVFFVLLLLTLFVSFPCEVILVFSFLTEICSLSLYLSLSLRQGAFVFATFLAGISVPEAATFFFLCLLPFLSPLSAVFSTRTCVLFFYISYEGGREREKETEWCLLSVFSLV